MSPKLAVSCRVVEDAGAATKWGLITLFGIFGRLATLLCRLVGFDPVRRRVAIHVDDAVEPSLYNGITMGIIHSVMEENLVFGREESSQPSELYAIVHLDSPLSTSGGDVSWLLAGPRHVGYGLHSICLRFIAVNVIFIEGPNPPIGVGLRWEGPAAICSMKVVR